MQLLKNFLTFYTVFGQNDKMRIAFLVGGGIVMSLLEFIGISAILPLLILIIQPQAALQNDLIRTLYAFFHVSSVEQLTIVLGILIAGLFIGKNIFQLIYWHFEHKLLAAWRLKITNYFYRIYMNSSYEDFTSRNSSHMINMITRVIPLTITSFIHQFFSLINYSMTGALILFYIIHINWMISLLMFATGATLLTVYTWVFRKKSIRIGQDIAALTYQQHVLLQQSFFGFKDIAASLKKSFFTDKFQTVTTTLTRREEQLMFLRNMPSPVVELAAMLIMLVIFLVIFYTGSNIQSTSAQIGVIVLACTRMLPVINRSINCITFINSARTIVNDLFTETRDRLNRGYFNGQQDAFDRAEDGATAPAYNRSLAVANLSYRYAGKDQPVLKGIDFSIQPGEFVGIVGPSGSGKSTLINILTGHLENYTGLYAIDDVPMTGDYATGLKKMMSYVDQNVFILEASIAENVAFGEEQIDTDRVQTALDKAQLGDFVAALPDGIHTFVGENGKLLSGGQKQRLAIARAFYRDFKVLILDEASSSLDVETEHDLFNVIAGLKGRISVIAIAHRFSTLKSCDRLYFMDQGEMTDSGTFEELYERNVKFKFYVDQSQYQAP